MPIITIAQDNLKQDSITIGQFDSIGKVSPEFEELFEAIEWVNTGMNALRDIGKDGVARFKEPNEKVIVLIKEISCPGISEIKAIIVFIVDEKDYTKQTLIKAILPLYATSVPTKSNKPREMISKFPDTGNPYIIPLSKEEAYAYMKNILLTDVELREPN